MTKHEYTTIWNSHWWRMLCFKVIGWYTRDGMMKVHLCIFVQVISDIQMKLELKLKKMSVSFYGVAHNSFTNNRIQLYSKQSISSEMHHIFSMMRFISTSRSLMRPAPMWLCMREGRGVGDGAGAAGWDSAAQAQGLLLTLGYRLTDGGNTKSTWPFQTRCINWLHSWL